MLFKSELSSNHFLKFEIFKRQPHKMVNTLKLLFGKWPANCFGVFDHFEGLALKGLSIDKNMLNAWGCR